jgi:hypothetical protein
MCEACAPSPRIPHPTSGTSGGSAPGPEASQMIPERPTGCYRGARCRRERCPRGGVSSPPSLSSPPPAGLAFADPSLRSGSRPCPLRGIGWVCSVRVTELLRSPGGRGRHEQGTASDRRKRARRRLVWEAQASLSVSGGTASLQSHRMAGRLSHPALIRPSRSSLTTGLW